MANDSGKGTVRFFDDFNRKAIDSTNYWSTNSDSGGTAFAINDQANGVVRGGVDTTDNDITNLFSPVIYRATAGGPLTVEWRAKPITSVADGETFIGISDATTDETPILLSTADVQTDDATDAAGFAYTGGGTANWKAVAVKADASKTPVACNKGGVTTPVVNTYQTFKVVVNQDGDADYWIDGKWQARIDSAITPGTLMCAAVAIQGGGTARSLDIDYCDIYAGRV